MRLSPVYEGVSSIAAIEEMPREVQMSKRPLA